MKRYETRALVVYKNKGIEFSLKTTKNVTKYLYMMFIGKNYH